MLAFATSPAGREGSSQPFRFRPNDGFCRVPVIRIGITAPALLVLKIGSSAFSKNDLTPVVVWDSLASKVAVPIRPKVPYWTEFQQTPRPSQGSQDHGPLAVVVPARWPAG